MFRRRPKAAPEPDASSQAERRKRGKAAPPGPLSDPEPRTETGDGAVEGESSEPWYRQSGPLFDESFRDSPPATPPPDDETAATVFAPPLPADPAASGVPPSVPIIQRVGQVTDPGPLGEEMRSAFEPPAAAAAADDEPAADDETGGDEPAADQDAAGDETAGDQPAADQDAADDAAASTVDDSAAGGAAQPQEAQRPWAPPAAPAPHPEPGFGLDDAEAAEDDGRPLIDFHAGATSDDEASGADAYGTAGDDIAAAHDDAGDGDDTGGTAAHDDETGDGDGDGDDTGGTEAYDETGDGIAEPHDGTGAGDAEAGDSETGEDALEPPSGDAETGEDALEPPPDDAEPGDIVDDATPEDDAPPDDAAPEGDDESAPDEGTPDASALAATAPSSEVAQQEPPMVVPVRGYYIARTEDTLRSVAAQFLNAPERWSELRALNAAYPGIADLDPDELVPEGAALALPGDPLPWGRPDPVYLWTLAETFLYTAWGREPAPEEVVPFWRGLTQGALPEGEQRPLGAELPGIAEIAARSDQPGDETPTEAAAPPVPPAAFEMPAVTEAEADTADIDLERAPEATAEEPATAEPAAEAEDKTTEAAQVEPVAEAEDETTEAAQVEPVAAETPADEPDIDDHVDAADLDADRADSDFVSEAAADAADVGPEQAPEATTEVVAEAEAEAKDEPEQTPEVATAGLAVADAEAEADAEDGPDSEPVPEAAAAPVDAPVDISEAPADDHGTVPADAAEAPQQPAHDTAELAGLVQAVEEAIEEGAQAIAEGEPDVEHRAEDITVDLPPADVPEVGPDVAPEPDMAPAADVVDTGFVEQVEETAAEPVEPPPMFDEWPADPSAPPPHPDPSAPYAGMPSVGTAGAPPLPPETEAPRAPQFMPSVTSSTPGGLTTAAQTSPVGRSLAGTAVGDAMLLWQLARRRRQGQRAAGAPDAIEQSLLQSAGSESLELIEAAMRHLRAVTVGQQRPEPSVLAVRSGTYGFEVLLDRPVPTPPGWRSASGGYVLELPQGVTARDLGAIGQGPSLCPALVPVGNTFEGPLLLNLERLGCLAISGPGAAAVGLLGAIVGALGSSPMAGHMRITAVGLESAASMIGWEAVSFASYDSPELESLLANAYGPGDGVIDVLVIGPGNDLLIQRAGQVATAAGSRLSLVGATSAVSARWPWRIHVDGTGTAVVHPISITMTAARAVPSETLAPLGGAVPGGIDPAGLR